jgi:ubiquinone/menaquinone biosynthesis C-methylase UbiE
MNFSIITPSHTSDFLHFPDKSMTNPSAHPELTTQVHDFWNRQSCDTHIAGSEKFSREYFEEIERYRYYDQPFIHSFAQFSRYRGKEILEIGFGAGTDYIQWLRSGAIATGVDLTEEGFANLRHRIQTYDLPEPKSVRVENAESLSFASNSFDLVYSFGVLHHCANTDRALSEAVRVLKPGGELKIMLYNSRSILALNTWVRHALLKGRPWRSFRDCIWHHVESLGTKAYTRRELVDKISNLGLRGISIQTEITSADTLASSAFLPLNLLYRFAIWLAGDTYPWQKKFYSKGAAKNIDNSDAPLFSGNPLGFFHCIKAIKN